MKIAQLMTGSNLDLENRKRALQRREMGEAYRKTQQYQSAKNPLLEALENLLSGKTEKELHAEQEKEPAQKSSPNYVADVARSSSSEDETVQILEDVKIAALSSGQPSLQDLRIAARATAQIEEKTTGFTSINVDALDDLAPFADEDLTVQVPERFQADFAQRDAQNSTLFGKNLESTLMQRTFQKATAKYTQHTEMVKNGYRSFDEPKFSEVA